MEEKDEKDEKEVILSHLVHKWVGKKSELPLKHLYKLLQYTGSYIAGPGLYTVLKMRTEDTEDPIEIYATKEGAKLFAFQMDSANLRRLSPLTWNKQANVLLKNGITSSIHSGDGNIVIYICENPDKVVRNLLINHHQVFFNGKFLNMSVLKKEPKLNDLFIEDYLSFNPYINAAIAKFITNADKLHIDIKEEDAGLKSVYSKNSPTKESKDRFITYSLFHSLSNYQFVNAIFVNIDSSPSDYTFKELVDSLNRSKDKVLLEVYEGDVKKLIANELLEYHRSQSEEWKEAIEQYCIENLGVRIEDIERIVEVKNSQRYRIRQEINVLRQVSEIQEKIEAITRTDSHRTVRNLEFFTKPSDRSIKKKAYNETDHDKCMDMEALSLYDINAYLNGEAVMAYDQDGEEVEDYAINPVPIEIARKRLVFFVASDRDLVNIKPFCYNLDLLEKDLGTRIYSDSCTEDGGMGDINRGFSNPLFKLAFESTVYVRLSKLLKALYSTNKQVFLLIPTDEIVPRTASLSSAVYHLQVGGDHCQAGTEKRVYDIVICGKGSDKCYPVNQYLEARSEDVDLSRDDDNDYKDHLDRFEEEIKIAQYEQALSSDYFDDMYPPEEESESESDDDQDGGPIGAEFEEPEEESDSDDDQAGGPIGAGFEEQEEESDDEPAIGPAYPY